MLFFLSLEFRSYPSERHTPLETRLRRYLGVAIVPTHTRFPLSRLDCRVHAVDLYYRQGAECTFSVYGLRLYYHCF